MSTADDYLAKIRALEKANRGLQRKLERSQSDRLKLEVTNEKKEFLLRKIIQDLNQSEQQLQDLVEGTASTTGPDFFPALVCHIARVLQVPYALVTEWHQEQLQILAFCSRGTLHSATRSYQLVNTPCEQTLRHGLFYCADRLPQQFPEYLNLLEVQAKSYLGIALRDTQGKAIGNLCILDAQPIQNPQRAGQLLQVFAARAAAELERQRAMILLQQLNQALELKVEERAAALQEREARYQALVDVIPDLMVRLRADGTHLDVIPGDGVRIFNPQQAHRGINIFDALPFEHAQQRMFYVHRALETREVQVYDYELTIDGKVYSEEARTIAINDDEVLVIVRDITTRKQAEAQVQALLNRTQLLNRISSEIRDSLDLGSILQNSVNSIFSELSADICTFSWYQDDGLTGIWKTVKEQKIASLASWIGGHSLDEFPLLLDHIIRNRIYRIEQVSSLDDKPLRQLLDQVGITTFVCLPIHTIGGKIGGLQIGRALNETPWLDEEIELLQDIGNQVAIAIYQAQLYEESQTKTEKLQRSYQDLKDTQLQLIQSEKMSSLGQLVAGIAHEINNPMSFIYGNLAVASDYTRDLAQLIRLYQDAYPIPTEAIASFMANADVEYILDDLPPLLASMETGVTRIRNIVQSLRTFSRLDQSSYKSIDIHENIDNTLVILQNRLNGRAGNPEIHLIRQYGDLPLVECYSGLLNQVFMNLLANAIDAIEERQAKAPPDYSGCITIKTAIAPSQQVTISIADNGVGMAPHVQAKIFNPFFTTKSVGVGTGMGLSISYQIVTGNHQGQLTCRSAPGVGTEFVIQLQQRLSEIVSEATSTTIPESSP